jgi:hypothetical protein
MLALIKGAAGTGKSALAERLVSALDLPPVDWPLSAENLRIGQELMGEWVDLAAYFAQQHHLDLERVVTLLAIEVRDELPPPRWRPGADRREMVAWRGRIVAEIFSGRLLPSLFELTCRLIDAAPETVIEGELLGSTLADSHLTKMLLERYRRRPVLRVLLMRPPRSGDGGSDPVALVNGRKLTADEVVGVLRRGADGAVEAVPEVGWTWRGESAPPLSMDPVYEARPT